MILLVASHSPYEADACLCGPPEVLAPIPFLIYAHAIGHAEAVIFGTGIAQAEVEVEGETAERDNW